jgi:hypothetical protein
MNIALYTARDVIKLRIWRPKVYPGLFESILKIITHILIKEGVLKHTEDRLYKGRDRD